MNTNTTIIPLCGSSQFKNILSEVTRRITSEDNLVFAPLIYHNDGTDTITPGQFQHLACIRRKTIALVHKTRVIDVGGGIEEITKEEVAYTRSKDIRYLSERKGT